MASSVTGSPPQRQGAGCFMIILHDGTQVFMSDHIYDGLLRFLIDLNDPENIILIEPARDLSLEQLYHGQESLQSCGRASQATQVGTLNPRRPWDAQWLSQDGRPASEDNLVTPGTQMQHHCSPTNMRVYDTQTTLTSNGKRPSDTQAAEMCPQRKRAFHGDRNRSSGDLRAIDGAPQELVPQIYVFSSDPNAGKKSRKPYQPTRRIEVAFMRTIGACDCCRIHKRPCSKEWPCRSCAEKSLPTALCVQPCIKANFSSSDFFGRWTTQTRDRSAHATLQFPYPPLAKTAVGHGNGFNRALTERFCTLAARLDLEDVLRTVLPRVSLGSLFQLLQGQASQDLKVVLLSTVFLSEVPDLLFEQYPIIKDICHRRSESGDRFLCTLERLFQPKSLAKRTQAQRDVLAFLALLTASIVAYGFSSNEPLHSEVYSDSVRDFEACRFHLTAALLHYAAAVRKGCRQDGAGEAARWRHAGLWVAVFRGITLHAWM